MTKKTILLITAFALLAIGLFAVMPAAADEAMPAQDHAAATLQGGENEGCLTCHEGIENIRDPESDMMKQIMAKGECTACHGGNPAETADADAAHTGAPAGLPFDEFFPDPGSIWVADQTCGQCHVNYAHAVERSLMNTEAGKIQGNFWAFGIPDDYSVTYGNYDVEGSETLFGTDTYKAYMEKMKAAYPDQYPTKLVVPPLPTKEEIKADPKLAGITYSRQQCQRCHVGVKGRAKRGDWRGQGCSSCHIPYSNEGLYEGGDPTIPTDEPGHLLVHSIQGTREARGGIPTESCVSCHNRGKRIGVSYQGIMEFPYGTPFYDDGTKQDGGRRLHTKRYLFIKDDLHHEKMSRPENPEGGLLCQDCHTSIDMHGDGNIFGTTLGQVEIECEDCHGLPTAYPWELPVGYGEEFAALGELSTDARGLGGLMDLATFDGTLYDAEDGYLLSARGNPLGNVVLQSDGKVLLHSATGKDFFVPVLKDIADSGEWVSLDAEVAMTKIGAHMENLECYACHSDWAPQCYGCHVKATYGVDKDGNEIMDTDWLLTAAEKYNGTYDNIKSPGKIMESRSYLRWEEPVLGINGEGRVTPLMPGCQVIFTVIVDGETITHNEIGRTPPNTEGAGPEGQRGLDMAPVQPHTAGRQARTCESCHSNPKTLGYGIEGGRFLKGYDQDRYVELENPDGSVMPENARVTMAAIPDLPMDLSQIVDPETGQQMQTVGSHWPGSGPLSEDQRTRMERTGVCMGCHQNMADEAFWTDQVIAKFGTVMSNDEHINMMNTVLNESVGSSDMAAPAESSGGPSQADLDAAEAKAAEAQAAAEAAEAKAAEAEAALADAEAQGSGDADAAIADANAKAEAAEAKAATAEAKAAEAAAAPAAAPSSGGNMTLWTIVALILGLVVGGGAVFFTRKS